jgi:catechol 2,3-dioxygenase-like lactoylglutathione lyase family enzyme
MSDECLVKDLSFRVHHTMLPVADLDRSVTFYTQNRRGYRLLRARRGGA